MSHYYGGVDGNRGDATRMGTKDSGFRAYAQTHYSRISVSLRHRGGDDDNDIATVSLGGGWSTGYRSHSLSFNPNLVAEALDSGDQRVQRLWDQIEKAIAKLDDEAPEAIARVEKKRRKEQRRMARERQRRENERAEILSQLDGVAKARLTRVLGVEWDDKGNVASSDLYLLGDHNGGNLRYDEEMQPGTKVVVVDARIGNWARFPFDIGVGQWILPALAEELDLDGDDLKGYGYRLDARKADEVEVG